MSLLPKVFPPPLDGETEFTTDRRTRLAWLQWVGAAVGVALLVAAIIMVWKQRDVVAEGIRSTASLSRGELAFWIGLMMAMVVANLALSAAVLNLLIGRLPASEAGVKPHVGWMEMHALITASTLLNFVPMRPGLIGRVAYHRAYNNISVKQSTAVMVQAIGLSGIAGAFAIVIVLLPLDSPAAFAGLALAPVGIALAWLVTGMALRRRPARGVCRFLQPAWLRLTAAGLARYIELLTMAVRYYAAFALIGSPIDARSSLAFACISVAANFVPFLSNGLGLREWAIGTFARVLTPHRTALGITADLVHRGVEIIVFTVLGLAGLVYLARLRTRRAAAA